MTMPNPALEHAREQFARSGLPFPPLPDDFADHVQAWDEWHWGTREDAPGLYNLDEHVDELLNRVVKADYLQFGHAGHGINSYAMNYYLVRGPLVVFDQIAWGGAYTDNAAAVEKMAIHWAKIGEMMAALDEAMARNLIHPEEQFIVIASDLY